MLYYRKKVLIKRILTNILKVFVPLTLCCCLVSFYNGADKQTLESEPITNTPEIIYDGTSVLEPASEPLENTSSEEASVTEENCSFIEPAVGVLTSSFGIRYGRQHNGIDIGGKNGSEILASESGVVICSEWVNGYGNYIIIEHKNNYKTAYAHCDSFKVAKGDLVKKGQVIALMGSTGNSTGPHLHFEIIENGEYLNPLNYVSY